jgi:hypothetical protein
VFGVVAFADSTFTIRFQEILWTPQIKALKPILEIRMNLKQQPDCGALNCWVSFALMKSIPFVLVLGLLAGCATDNARLHGTWQSNSEATVAAAFQQNPGLTNLPPERLERFKDLYGHMTVTFSNGLQTTTFRGRQEKPFHYWVVKSGRDFVVLHSAINGIPNPRIRFVEGGKSYWVGGGCRYEERFDRIDEK